jgi:hypothetical protein
MVKTESEIVGIESIKLDTDAGTLVLRLILSDGSIGATHWRLADLRESVGIVEGPRHAPMQRASVN